MKHLLKCLFSFLVILFFVHSAEAHDSVIIFQGGSVRALLANGMPFGVGTTAQRPLTCTANKEWYWSTDATAGAQLYSCNSAAAWILAATGVTPTLQTVVTQGRTVTDAKGSANAICIGGNGTTVAEARKCTYADAALGWTETVTPAQDSTTQLSAATTFRIQNSGTVDLFSVTNQITPTQTTFLVDMPQPAVAGTRSSHFSQWRGSSFDTVGHSTDWRAWNQVTSNAGASTFTIDNRIDAAAFSAKLLLGSTGTVVDTATGGANFVLLYNSTAAQEVAVYNTTDATFTNTEFGQISWRASANAFRVMTGATGTGVVRELMLGQSLVPTRLRTNCATPATPALGNGDFWSDTAAGNCTSATGTINIKLQHNGITRTIASVTF